MAGISIYLDVLSYEIVVELSKNYLTNYQKYDIIGQNKKERICTINA